MTKISFKSIWEDCEKKNNYPSRANNIKVVDYKDFEKNVTEEKESFVLDIVNSLYSGDIYILKGAYTKEFMNSLRVRTFDYFKDKPSEFHKMLEGCPDFHRKIDIETGKKYALRLCKHSFYFYPWNNDPLNIFNPIYKRWRVIKKLMGMNPEAFEQNTPKDGVIDRIQIVQYPSKIGYLEPHTDPHKHQRLFHSAYMSKKGKDFSGLGFYAIDKKDKILETEDHIDVGDIGIGYATVYHGVAPVNLNKEPDWQDVNDGRWFLSLYSNETDIHKKRHTSSGVSEKLNFSKNIKSQVYPLEILS
tara:strand:- start:1007 stop:1912 length:906 start_codon:yes stop_codon:yes gene_type:complete